MFHYITLYYIKVNYIRLHYNILYIYEFAGIWENGATPKSLIFIGCSIIKLELWGSTMAMDTSMAFPHDLRD